MVCEPSTGARPSAAVCSGDVAFWAPSLLAVAPATLPSADVGPWIDVLLSPWSTFFAFFWGAIWGSFANVVIYRLPRGESVVSPRSRCPACGTAISGFDNVPVLSYLLLRGRCRACKAPFSPRYLMVELLAGMLSFAVYRATVHVPLVGGGSPDLIAWQLGFLLCLTLLVIVFIDLDLWIIPDVIVLPMAVIGLGIAIAAPTVFGVGWIASLAAAAAGYGVFAGIRWLYLRFRGIEALGLGDAKLLAMVGAWTGPVGLAWCVGAGAIQGLLVAVPMLLLGKDVATTDLHEVHGDDPELGGPQQERSVMGRHVPFGPFLGLAALEYVLLGPQIRELLGALIAP